MSKMNHDDINDDEIRIISKEENNFNIAPVDFDSFNENFYVAPEEKEQPKRRHRKGWWLIVSLLIVIALIIIGVLLGREEEAEEPIIEEPAPVVAEEPAIVAQPKGTVAVVDTVIGRQGLRIFEPQNARAALILGEEALADSTIILATRAADIRSDNNEIVGTFVLDGELISQGESKAGYCAIIDGQPSIGIADATPLLEQALTEKGYFFRQYPLVVGGQTVENKPKNRAVRKALAEIGSKICVVVSREKLTFGEFSELLVEAGVRNAIYLCGGDSYGFYADKSGQRLRIDNGDEQISDNISFIIWR